MWYQKFDLHMLVDDFVCSKINHYIHDKYVVDHFIILALSVDDILLVSNNEEMN